jgi:cell division protein FtsB
VGIRVPTHTASVLLLLLLLLLFLLVLSSLGLFAVWQRLTSIENKGCVTMWACPITLKKYLKAKEKLQKPKIFHHANIYNLQKLL